MAGSQVVDRVEGQFHAYKQNDCLDLVGSVCIWRQARCLENTKAAISS